MKAFFKRYPAFWITVAILGALEAAARIIPLEYASGAGIFVTEYRKDLVEASAPEFDYIILGDSRSLSLNGHPSTEKEPYTVYNLSLPAMGPRYFKYFLETYLEKRTKKPSAIIFAGDPGLFQKSWNTPNHDVRMIYASSVDEGLGSYLWTRFERRLEFLKRRQGSAQKDAFGAMVWDVFSHRYVHLFDVTDMLKQYTGAEMIFMVRESIPNAFYLYRFRDAITKYTLDLNRDSFKAHPLPDACRKCENIARAECHPDLARVPDNRAIAARLNETYGQINLGDRLTLVQRLGYYQIRDRAIQQQVDFFLREEPDLAPLESFIQEAVKQGVPVFFSDVPAVEPMRHVRYHRIYFEKLADLERKYPNVHIMRFPDPYYPVKLFIEQVHYECEGAERLNREFYDVVFPGILKIAPPGSNGSQK